VGVVFGAGILVCRRRRHHRRQSATQALQLLYTHASPHSRHARVQWANTQEEWCHFVVVHVVYHLVVLCTTFASLRAEQHPQTSRQLRGPKTTGPKGIITQSNETETMPDRTEQEKTLCRTTRRQEAKKKGPIPVSRSESPRRSRRRASLRGVPVKHSSRKDESP